MFVATKTPRFISIGLRCRWCRSTNRIVPALRNSESYARIIFGSTASLNAKFLGAFSAEYVDMETHYLALSLSLSLSLSLNVFWWTNAKLQCYIHTYWCTHPCRQILLTFCPTCCLYSHSFFLVGLCWKSLTLIYFTSSISTSSQVGKAGPSFSFCCVDTTLPFHIVYTHLCMNNLPISLSPHQYKESAICWCVLHHSTEAIIRLAKVRPWIASLFLSFPMPLYWLRCLSLSLSFSVPSYTCVLFF